MQLKHLLQQRSGSAGCSCSHSASGTLQGWAAPPRAPAAGFLRAFSTQQAGAAGGAGGAKPRFNPEGPITFRSLMVTLFAGAGIVAAARAYQQDKMQERMAKTQETVGKAAVGGPFRLVDTNGKPFTERNLVGEFSVLYFGFTHCPDICPDELEKLAAAVDAVEGSTGRRLLPVFISVDPERDTPQLVRQYVREFHPRMVGLTGDVDSVKAASKAYRVYYHKTTDSDKDYLVDHSIIMYLLSPEGEFVTFYGKNFTVEQLSASIAENVAKWAADHPDYQLAPAAAAGKAAVAAPAAKK